MDANRETRKLEWVKVREDAEIYGETVSKLYNYEFIFITGFRSCPPPTSLPRCDISSGRKYFLVSIQKSIQAVMASDLTLPGQPIPLPRGPVPQLGSGIYSRDGQVRASLVGVPRYEGSVGLQSSMRYCHALNDMRRWHLRHI